MIKPNTAINALLPWIEKSSGLSVGRGQTRQQLGYRSFIYSATLQTIDTWVLKRLRLLCQSRAGGTPGD